MFRFYLLIDTCKVESYR